MPYVPKPEEKNLIDRCINGDSRAQKILFERHYGKMLGVCIRYATDRDEAKDIMQEAFIKVFQKLSQFNYNSPLEAWIRRIMVNTAIDSVRKRNSEPVAYDNMESDYELAVEEDVLSDMTYEELLSCLQELPAGYRTVFNMYVIEGFSHKDIAEALEITEGTSKSQLSKARLYLQKVVSNKFSTENE